MYILNGRNFGTMCHNEMKWWTICRKTEGRKIFSLERKGAFGILLEVLMKLLTMNPLSSVTRDPTCNVFESPFRSYYLGSRDGGKEEIPCLA
jgi:hypothetical protein